VDYLGLGIWGGKAAAEEAPLKAHPLPDGAWGRKKKIILKSEKRGA